MARATLKLQDPAPEAAPAVPEPAPAPSSPTVRVMLLCKSVFLPGDLARSDWPTSADTRKYQGETENGRRAKLDVHPALAEFLQKRKQAEILDD